MEKQMWKVSSEPFTEKFWDEMEPLVEIHKNEATIFPGCEPDPDIQMHLFLQDHGFIHLQTARVDGKLVGYILFHVGPHLQFKQIICATHMSMFIHPEYRGGSLFFELMAAAEAELKENNVDAILMHSVAMNDIGRLYKHLDYDIAETFYLKKLRSDLCVLQR